MSGCAPDAQGHCSLCGDDAVEARVITVDAVAHLATARVNGDVAIIALDLVGEVAVGDVVLVHQGFAIGRVDDAEAAR